MNKTLKAGLVVLGLSLALLLYSREKKREDGGTGLVFQIEYQGRIHFVAGSFHLLRKIDYPLPRPYSDAYLKSGEIVFELEKTSAGSGGAASNRLFDAGRYQNEDRLSRVLPVEIRQKLASVLREMELSEEVIDGYRPWLVALTLASAKHASLGAVPEYGMEHHFEALCNRDGKVMSGLESVDEQIAMFENLSDIEALDLLEQTLDEITWSQNRASEFVRAWRRGDLNFVADQLEGGRPRNPKFYEQMIDSRNLKWVSLLLDRMEGERTLMILVGAGHLGGRGGLIKLLEQRGAKVLQLTGPDPS